MPIKSRTKNQGWNNSKNPAPFKSRNQRPNIFWQIIKGLVLFIVIPGGIIYLIYQFGKWWMDRKAAKTASAQEQAGASVKPQLTAVSGAN